MSAARPGPEPSNSLDEPRRASDSPQDATARTTLLTPAGRSALATVRVCGPETTSLVASLCRADPADWLARASSGRLVISRWKGGTGERVVIRVVDADHVEITCHGGSVASAMILKDLARVGVPFAAPHEFLAADAESMIEIECLDALARAATERVAAVLLDQMNGALVRSLVLVRRQLEMGDVASAASGLFALLARADFGLHLTSPWRVAIVGRPNVGKSSLLNALVGFGRAIVHPTAGTTRDLVTAAAAFDGWPVELIDSAGLRVTADPLERAGVERAEHAIEQSDLQLVVLDGSQPLERDDFAILGRCPRPLAVANKSDLPPAWDAFARFPQANRVSALSIVGIANLVVTIAGALVPAPPAPGDAAPFTIRQVERLEAAIAALAAGDAARAAADILALNGPP